MSEKRFTYFKVPVGFAKQAIKDNANDEVFDFTLDNVLDKLNEQQATISRLEENIERIKIKLLKMEKVIDRMLSKEEQIGFYNLVELEFYNMMELEMIRDE